MRRLAAQNTSDGDERIVPLRRGQFFRRQRQFECSRNMHHIHVFAGRSSPFQRIHRRGKKPFRNKTIEAAYNDAKAKTGGAQRTINLAGLYFLRHHQCAPIPAPILYFLYLIYFLYFPLNCAGLFSRNALVPSRMSSVAQATPKSAASRNNPSS